MITITIPSRAALHIERVVLDVNSTLTLDGALLPGVVERIARLQEQVGVELLTADTRGRLVDVTRMLRVRGVRLEAETISEQKRAYIEGLGAAGMAGIGIVVLGPEGAAGAALRVADVVTAGITDALDLLLEPLRLVATLRP